MNSKSAQLLHESVPDQWPRWTTCSLQCVRTAPSLVQCRPPKAHGGLYVATVCRHMVHAKAAVPAQNDGPCREHNSVAFNIHTCKHIQLYYINVVHLFSRCRRCLHAVEWPTAYLRRKRTAALFGIDGGICCHSVRTVPQSGASCSGVPARTGADAPMHPKSEPGIKLWTTNSPSPLSALTFQSWPSLWSHGLRRSAANWWLPLRSTQRPSTSLAPTTFNELSLLLATKSWRCAEGGAERAGRESWAPPPLLPLLHGHS